MKNYSEPKEMEMIHKIREELSKETKDMDTPHLLEFYKKQSKNICKSLPIYERLSLKKAA